MAYTPKNLQIFNAAYCGTLAGMGVSDRVLKDTNAVSYAGLATIAGAFAQAVDTAWGISRPTSLLDVTAVEDACVAAWQSRSPIVDAVNTNPATHAQLALAIIAQITASESYYAAEGIVPPPIPGVGPNNYVGYAVANLSDLSLVPSNGLNNGLLYYVNSIKSLFTLDKTSVLTSNGITIVNALDGGRWLRTEYADPFWATVGDWYLNAVTGNDENNGTTALTPLKTHAELMRRWGQNTLVPPLNYPAANVRVCNVRHQTSMPASDAISIFCKLPANTCIYFPGGVESVLYSGTITGLTAINPASQQPYEITDSSLPGPDDWSDYLGARIRITTPGATFNSMAWVAKNLGARTSRTSNFYRPDQMNPANAAFLPFYSAGAEVAPIVGNAFNIERMFQINVGSVSPDIVGGAGVITVQRVIWGELEFRRAPNNYNEYNAITHIFYSCKYYNETANTLVLKGAIASFINCQFGMSTDIYPTSYLSIFAGLLLNPISAINGLTVVPGSGVVQLAADFMCQGIGIRGTNLVIDAACVFDAVSISAAPGGHGLYIGAIGNTLAGGAVPRAWANIRVRLWGNGNQGYGVQVGAACAVGVFFGSASTIITGTAGDFQLNFTSTSRAWNESGGAFTAPIANTWANYNLAVGSGGLGGNAQDVKSQAIIMNTFVS